MDAPEEGIPPLNAADGLQPEPQPEDNDEPPPTLGDIEEQEVLLTICAQLESPQDLGRLACVSRAFGGPTMWVGGGSQSRSVVEESARRWVLARTPSAEGTRSIGEQRGRGCWLRRMHELQTRRFVQVAENSLAADPVGAPPLDAVQVSAVEGQPKSVRLKLCPLAPSGSRGRATIMRSIVGDEVLEPGVHELRVELVAGPSTGGQHFGVVKDGAPLQTLNPMRPEHWFFSKDGWALMQNSHSLFFRHNDHREDVPATLVGDSFTLTVDTALGELRACSDDGSASVGYKMPDFDPHARYRFAVSLYTGTHGNPEGSAEAIVTR